MKFNIANAIAVSLVSAVTFSAVVPAQAQQTSSSCRRVISIEGSPAQSRAVAGYDYNQIPVYENAEDAYASDKKPLGVVSIGQRVSLMSPVATKFVNDPADQNGLGTKMIAITTADGQERWIPLAKVALAGGRNGSTTYTTMSSSTLGYCSIRALW